MDNKVRRGAVAFARKLGLHRKRVSIPLTGLFFVATTVLAAWVAPKLLPGLYEWFAGTGEAAPWLFVGFLALGTVLVAPITIFNVAAGALFGMWYGTLWSFVGTFAGSTTCFFIARLGPRRWVEKKLRRWPRFAVFDKSLARDGRNTVALLRLSPVLPLPLVSYALGLSRVRVQDFLISAPVSVLPMLPFIYTGKLAGDLIALARGESEKLWWEWLLLGVGFLATGWVAWLLTKKVREALGTGAVASHG